MHSRILITLALVQSCLWTAAASHVLAQIPDVPGWKLSFHDEFDGTTLNTTNWVANDRENQNNNEKQYYRHEQVSVADGNLKITAINVPRGNKQYQSGIITSQTRYGIGRYEARIDLPTSQGMWPAFWLNPNNSPPWPTGGEIDILENRGSQPNLTSSAYHWQTNPGPCCNQHEYVFHEYTASQNGSPVNFHSGFHTYAVEWEETRLRFYVDGNLHFTVAENPARPIFEVTKNIILNLAIGGDFGGDPNGTTVWPQTMLVDYVRVWQRDTSIPGDYNSDGTIDAADYSVWRDSQGQSAIGLPADGSGNGTVGPEDYQLWKANYGGDPLPGEAASSANVPEPATSLTLSLGLVLFCTQRFWCVRTVAVQKLDISEGTVRPYPRQLSSYVRGGFH